MATAPVSDLPQPLVLKEYSEAEWRAIAKRLSPEWTDDDISAAWTEYGKFNLEFVKFRRSRDPI